MLHNKINPAENRPCESLQSYTYNSYIRPGIYIIPIDLSMFSYCRTGLLLISGLLRLISGISQDTAGSYLPLVIIHTRGAYIQTDVKVMVDMGIIYNGPGNLNYPTDPFNDYDGKVGIEYRGSSSLGFPKKNFGFETWTLQGADTTCPLLGLPAENDWVLHGPYSDKSLMRNFLAYHLFGGMGYYAPRTRLCELYLDDQHQGVYWLIEKIKRDEERVNISQLNPEDIAGDQLTGGYIVKIDRSATDYSDGWFSPYRGTGTSGEGPYFAFHYPSRTEIVPEQAAYIHNRITAFETALKSNGYRDPVTGYHSYIDVPSFISYFILVELSKNTDGYRLSTFLHKDRDSKDPLIYMGPVWDYDLAFGNADYYEAFRTYGWNYSVASDGWGTPFWWSRLLSDPYFANLLNCYWHSLRQGLLSDDSLTELIDSTVNAIGPAIDRNFEQWPIHGQYVWPNPYVGNTFEQDISYMKNWILARAAWLDDHMPGAYCTTGTEDPVSSSGISLRAYPNPARDVINLEIQNSQAEELTLEVFNCTGQLIHRWDTGMDIMIIHRIGLVPGAYLVRVSGGDHIAVTKVLVQ